MTNHTRLFKRFPRDFVELSKTGLDKERDLHDMIEQNIDVLFPNLVVLGSELERNGYRPDTIAFDKKRNTFAIIEYKNRQDSKVLDQASAYLVHMKRIKDSFKLLYFEKMGQNVDATKFDWNSAYAIIVSPEFTRIQIDSAQTRHSLTLYTVSVYDDNIISLTKVGDEKRADPTEGGDGVGPNPEPEPPNGIDRLYSIACGELLSAFSGMVVKNMKFYDRFEVGGRLLCTMGKQKSKIWLHYSGRIDNPAPDQSEFVEYIKRPGWGTGRWRSAIKNQADFAKALSILKRLHEHK